MPAYLYGIYVFFPVQENNCHGTMGNSEQKIGYGCMQVALVDLWRREWSRVPGTTDPLAPFGVVTLAAGGSEGGSDIAGMRWSQTANHGVLPNPAMPNTFLAQAYDLGDPWPSKTCYGWWCCWGGYNPEYCGQQLAKNNMATPTESAPAGGCQTYCDILGDTARRSNNKWILDTGALHSQLISWVLMLICVHA